MKKFLPPLLLSACLCSVAYGQYLSVQNPVAIVQSTNENLLGLMDYIQNLDPVAQGFNDVEEGVWYETATNFVAQHQIMSGTNNSQFSPSAPTTRGLLATVITNAEGVELGDYDNAFLDIEFSWYRDSANWCAQQGIMNGYSEEYFGGEEPVTREDLAMILYQYALFAGHSPSAANLSLLSSFTDQGDSRDYARNALAWAVEENLLYTSDNLLRPSDTATRADVAYGIMEVLSLLP